MQLYTDELDFEKRFQHFIDLLKKKKPVESQIDQMLITALEHQKHAGIIEFSPNSKAPGAIIGLGKEPDVPNETTKETLRTWGKAHVKNGLVGQLFYIFTEERLFDSWYLYITGGKKMNNKLYLPPHTESYRFEVVREKKGLIESIGDMIKTQILPYHKDYIDGYFDIDYSKMTALDQMAILSRGGKL